MKKLRIVKLRGKSIIKSVFFYLSDWPNSPLGGAGRKIYLSHYWGGGVEKFISLTWEGVENFIRLTKGGQYWVDLHKIFPVRRPGNFGYLGSRNTKISFKNAPKILSVNILVDNFPSTFYRFHLLSYFGVISHNLIFKILYIKIKYTKTYNCNIEIVHIIHDTNVSGIWNGIYVNSGGLNTFLSISH